MHIMTAEGWKPLSPARYAKPRHVLSMLEQMKIDEHYSGAREMARYANSPGRGVYFHYKSDGTVTQIKGAKHPLPGMFSEEEEEV